MNEKIKYFPILLILVFYLLVLLQTFRVAYAQNDFSYIVLGFIAPLPLLIGIFVALIKLIKAK